MGVLWDSVTGGFVARDEVYQFTIDEPVNYTEHDAWIEQLEPVWSWQDDCIGSFLVGVYVGEYPQFDRGEWCSIAPAALTVEADGDPAIMFASDGYEWPRFGGTSRWDNLFADLPYWRWYLVRHGELSHVAPCEVTL